MAKQETLNRQSREMTEGVARTPNRAMLRAIGFQDEDFRKPIVGLASAGAEVSPCNVHHEELVATAQEALKRFGCAPLKFNTFVVTDGMAMGGSTNAVLHLLALAREAEVDLDILDFNGFFDTTPILCDMKPDGRFSGGSHGMVVGHVAPEAQEGGTIALLRDGDRITIDSRKKLLSVELSE